MTDTPRLASFRQLDEYLKKAGYPRDEQMIRNNIYIAPLEWFTVEPGFNLRTLNEAHVEQFANAYSQGLYVPPVVAELSLIDGQPRLVIREGHHRLEAARRAEQRGAGLPGLMVSEFKGNKADAVVLMISSSQALPLTILQRAEGYKRLAGQGWKSSQIAEKLGRSVQHVDQLLLLANAEEVIKDLVRDDRIAASTVIEVLNSTRGTANDPYTILIGMLENAAARGKGRATPADARGATRTFRPGKKVIRPIFDALASLEAELEAAAEAEGAISIPLKIEKEIALELLKQIQKFKSN
ncbi:KorB domain-containing protein [Aquipseudomonas alcaligenes]|uniref:KorB domain-containing protein n=1 Tax=Aquipseudomonas alcaligenes TaxID=43263 RepID=A0A1N6XCN2_AQUAC|nr:KorB domain-containing protein [Pseudomonas alcaligenes]SIR00073.1 KorB domain-containing protein [Pseudomonas alcaligenes]